MHRAKVRTRFCTQPCFFAHRRRIGTKPCIICGKGSYRPPVHWDRAGPNIFCSKKCFGIWERGPNNPHWDGGDITKNCVTCGKIFVCTRKNRAKVTTCSKKCNSIRRRRKRVDFGRTDCPQCRVNFQRRQRIQRFCSVKCNNAAHAVRMRGKGNGRYVHGQYDSRYGLGWTPESKAKIRKRDGHKCRPCGMTQRKHGKLLCVHHIDYDKHNMKPSNLITCCRWCHGKMHGRLPERKKWKRKLSALLGA